MPHLLLTAAICYLIVGLLAAFFGPIGRHLHRQAKAHANDAVTGEFADENSVRSSKKVLFILTMGFARVLLWPIALRVAIIEEREGAVQENERLSPPIPERLPGLHVSSLSGAGSLACWSCGYHEEVTGFIHGFGDSAWSICTYQCQRCGALVALQNREEHDLPLQCQCGGALEREVPLSCPRCGGHDLDYECEFMT